MTHARTGRSMKKRASTASLPLENLKSEIPNPNRQQRVFGSFGFRIRDLGFRIWDFGFRICVWHFDLLQVSDFGFRISDGHVHQLRLDRDARPDLLQAVDDHALTRLEAVVNDAKAVVGRAQADGASDYVVFLVHDVDDLVSLIGV